MVARGLIVHPAVASMTRQFSRDAISLTAITDLPPIRLGLILCTTHYNARIRALAATARGIYRPSAQGAARLRSAMQHDTAHHSPAAPWPCDLRGIGRTPGTRPHRARFGR